MQIAICTGRFEQAMLEPGRLANPQDKTFSLKRRRVGAFIGRISYAQNDINDWLGGKAWN